MTPPPPHFVLSVGGGVTHRSSCAGTPPVRHVVLQGRRPCISLQRPPRRAGESPRVAPDGAPRGVRPRGCPATGPAGGWVGNRPRSSAALLSTGPDQASIRRRTLPGGTVGAPTDRDQGCTATSIPISECQLTSERGGHPPSGARGRDAGLARARGWRRTGRPAACVSTRGAVRRQDPRAVGGNAPGTTSPRGRSQRANPARGTAGTPRARSGRSSRCASPRGSGDRGRRRRRR